MIEPPIGTVTFLFTDLEGSTELWDRNPVSMREALRDHDALLIEAVTAGGGHIVKTTGDGIHAAFATPDAAVAAAVDAQLAIAAHDFGEPGPLTVRMGLHTGTAEYRDGDYYGPTLNRAARVMAAAHGGQILVSLATAELTRDSVGVTQLRDLGEFELRGLGRPERLFQVLHPGLRGEFPPPTTLEPGPGNLPVQLTSFIGRAAELERVRRAIAEAPLVTLVGVGGVGKTRLALQAATEAGVDYRDGAWLCELAGVREAAAVPSAVASSLGVQLPSAQDMTASVIAFLRGKQMLLVLDNCEHLLTPVADLVMAIMRTCAQVRILATSRESLNVAGEQILGVPSLSTPASDTAQDALAACDAVHLFVERAHAVKEDFVLDESNGHAVGELCRRLDGIPLAIELAAARVGMLTPAELAHRLDQRFRLLTGQERGAVERHQTLQAAVDWSYDLLDPREQRVLDRLSVFAGGFTLEAAEHVSNGIDVDESEVFEILGALVARQLVQADARGIETRYGLLETIRQYAQEHLEADGETDAVRRSHAAYYASFLERGASHLPDADGVLWAERLAREVDNMRAALACAIEQGAVALAVALVAAPDPWLGPRDVTAAFADAVEVVISLPGAQQQDRYGRALVLASTIATSRNDLELATRRADEALAIATGDDTHTLAWISLQQIAALQSDSEQSNAAATRAIELARASGDVLRLGQALAMAAVTYVTAGDSERGTRVAEEAVEIARRIATPHGRAETLALAGAALGEHDPERGFEVIREAIAVSEPLGISTYVWAIVAYLAHSVGDLRVALESQIKSIDTFHQLRASVWVGIALRSLAIVLGTDAPQDVALLHGWADAHTPDVSMFPRFEIVHDALIESVDQTLGLGAAQELRARGAAMSEDEIVEHANEAIQRALSRLAAADEQETREPAGGTAAPA